MDPKTLKDAQEKVTAAETTEAAALEVLQGAQKLLATTREELATATDAIGAVDPYQAAAFNEAIQVKVNLAAKVEALEVRASRSLAAYEAAKAATGAAKASLASCQRVLDQERASASLERLTGTCAAFATGLLERFRAHRELCDSAGIPNVLRSSSRAEAEEVFGEILKMARNAETLRAADVQAAADHAAKSRKENLAAAQYGTPMVFFAGMTPEEKAAAEAHNNAFFAKPAHVQVAAAEKRKDADFLTGIPEALRARTFVTQSATGPASGTYNTGGK